MRKVKYTYKRTDVSELFSEQLAKLETLITELDDMRDELEELIGDLTEGANDDEGY